MMLTLPSDIEIAASVTPRPIVDVARDVGLAPDDIEPCTASTRRSCRSTWRRGPRAAASCW